MPEVVIIGLGQLGRVFAGALLRAGCCVVPVNRGDDMTVLAAAHPAPDLVLVAVAEPDLHGVLAALPADWKSRAALIQNELLPRDWLAHGIENPTVIPVWFEKKKGSDAKPLIASPTAGPGADLLVRALTAIDIPARQVASGGELLFELVRKNVYILTTNIAGLKTGGTVAGLWQNHRDFAREVADEIMDIQDWLTGVKHDRAKLIAGMLEAFDGDPLHNCTGRSAPARLARAATRRRGGSGGARPALTATLMTTLRQPRAAASQIAIISKSSFRAPHSGQVQFIGTSSQHVPGGMPSCGQPFVSS